MSLKEKIRLRLPAYLVFSFLGLVGLLSLWLPNYWGQIDSAEAALTYSATTTIYSVPNDSRNRMLAIGDTYYVAYTSSTGATPTSTCGPSGSCNVYFTTSSNGTNWSVPSLVSSGLATDDGDNVASPLGGLSYSSRYGYFAIVYKLHADKKIYISTSTNGATWRGGVVTQSVSTGITAVSGRAYNAFSTSSDMAVIAYRNGAQIFVATTSDTMLTLSSWASSSVAGVTSSYDGNGYNSEVAGVSVEGADKIHVIYSSATTSASGIQYIHALSDDRGKSWTTSSISGIITPADSNLVSGAGRMASTALMPNGHLALLFRQFVSADLSGYPTVYVSSTMVYAVQNSGGTWVTSTFSAPRTNILLGDTTNFFVQHPALTIFNGTEPAGIYFATSSVLALGINTSTLVTETVTTDEVSQPAGMSIALNTSSRQLGMLYVSGYQMRFVTTSLRDPLWNSVPTSTAITPVFATSGTGYVTVTTTISDVETDTATLFVDYSLNGGTSWASTTLSSASATTGSVTASTGKVSNISTASANPVTFVWDSKTDGVTATTTAMIRIAAVDLYGQFVYRQSATFTVDNVPLSTSDAQSVTVSTSTATFTWSDVTGASSYTVSSTAGAASTTLSTVTSTSYTGLSPNTLYSFQVRNTDAYGNTSTFSSASSTYTDPVVPGTPSASAGGTTSMTVTWSANSNGSGTVYELYNVTAGASVGTTTQTSYSVTGLSAATSYQFKVRAQYLSNSASTTDYSTDSSAASTNSESTASTGGGAASAPAAPVLPPAPPTPTPAPAVDVFVVGTSKAVVVGGESHTVTVQNASEQQVTAEIRSNPIIVTLKKGEITQISTNNDDAKEMSVEYLGLVNGQPKLKFTSLLDIQQNSAAFSINSNAKETNSQTVRLDFNVDSAVQVAISSESDFAGAVFQTYQKSLSWKLKPGVGLKTLYARFRTAQGGSVTLFDNINLTASVPDTAPETGSEVTVPSTVTPSYTFTKNMYMGARGESVTELQKYLKSLGYFTDEPTGFYGRLTSAAVKKFQADHGIEQTGGAGPSTRAALNKGASAPSAGASSSVPEKSSVGSSYTFTKNMYMGARGESVTELQKYLKSLGYFTDEPTGFYGRLTSAAVKKFQADHGIEQTGGAGPSTRASLNR